MNLDFKNVTSYATCGQSHISASGREFSPCRHVRIHSGLTEWGLEISSPGGKEAEA
jgi:hypothetical protein